MTGLGAFNNLYCCHHDLRSSSLIFDFRSVYQGNPQIPRFRYRESLNCSRTLKLRSFRAFSSSSTAAGYNGWEDFKIHGESDNSEVLDRLRSFLVSIGINDKKYVFTFLLGLVSAFSISRFRISSIAVFPASILVFAIGFSFGFVRRDGFDKIGNKRGSKEEFGWSNNDKLRNLLRSFDKFDAKVSHLKNHVQKTIDSRRITDADLESCMSLIDSVRLLILDTRKNFDVSAANVGQLNFASPESQESWRRKESRGVVSNPFRLIDDLFGAMLAGWKYNKVSNNVKIEAVESWANDCAQEAIISSMKAKSLDKATANSSLFQDTSFDSSLPQDAKRKTNIDWEGEKPSSHVIGPGSDKFTDIKEYDRRDDDIYFANGDHVSLKMREEGEDNTYGAREYMLNPEALHMKASASFIQDHILEKSSRAHWISSRKEKFGSETSGSYFRKESRSYEAGFRQVRNLSGNTAEAGQSSPSGLTDDVLFNRYLTEANDLIREAKEFIIARHYDEQAEIILQKSASILSDAIALKPMSLLAVGQLGNTYLLHGELKLRISRELRASLSRSDPTLLVKQGFGDSFLKKKIMTHLVNTCGECEELLVKAGRSYKLALSIDGNDVRSLFNWGLALSFRGQLIADIGPEAASEADKIFMAAIDKFDAMVSKGNGYAPEALHRWGMALQQRSQLRPSESKEKLKLLQQAKRLYEDARTMESGSLQVRDADL